MRVRTAKIRKSRVHIRDRTPGEDRAERGKCSWRPATHPANIVCDCPVTEDPRACECGARQDWEPKDDDGAEDDRESES